MKEEDDEKLIQEAKSMMKSSKLTDALCNMIEKQRGTLGFLLGIMRRRPRTFNPFILKGQSIYSEPEALDRKTAELVAVGAASALKCEHCVEAHMQQAINQGATMDEIEDAILISGAIADSSTLSVSMRKFRQLEGKLEKK
jgi:AhpD family alkylhydroperoxidase